MQNLDTESLKSKPLTASYEWLEAMIEKSLYGENAGRLRLSGIKAMEGVLSDDEPKTVGYIIDNIDVIKSRYIVGNNANPDTARTYASRAVNTLKEYLLYLSDSNAFMRKKSAKTEASTGPKVRKRKTPRNLVEVAPSPEQTREPTPPSNMREYSLGEGRVVRFDLPPNMTQEEFRKFALHVYTLIGDFDVDRFGALAQSMGEVLMLREAS